jgi:chromosomal replication initiator protein
MNEYISLWEGVLAEVEHSTSKTNFSTWFKGTRIIKIDEGVVQLGVSSPFAYDWLSSKFHNETLRALRKLNEHIRALEYTIVKEEETKDSKESKKKIEDKKKDELAPTISMPLENYYINKDDNLNPRYSFDNFIVGPFNELAHAASQAVCKSPGASYNPLFIYGESGLGKTHLIQAVGNKIKKDFPDKKVFYLTSERFGSEYFSSLQTNTAQKFKDKYRKYDVIIMDDIQFFGSKEKFQEELFHLFNTFINSNRQLVFSSDKHPNFITELEDRLKTRFNSGMIVDIPTPDNESRVAIFKAKIRNNNMELSNDIVDYLAKHIEGSIREIEGVVNTIVCQTQLKGKLSIVEIKNLVKNSTKPKKNTPVKDVIKAIANFYNISEDSVFDKTRKKEVVKPRQVIMYILREDFNISFPSIGEKLGGRDHTTVIHSCEKIKDDLKTNPMLIEELSQIRALI